MGCFVRSRQRSGQIIRLRGTDESGLRPLEQWYQSFKAFGFARLLSQIVLRACFIDWAVFEVDVVNALIVCHFGFNIYVFIK